MGAKFEASAASINKQTGYTVVTGFGQNTRQPVSVIPTGVLMVDALTGIGGWPRGFISEVFGPESCGKGTLCLESIRECQEMGLAVLYLDYEHDFAPNYARNLGCDLSPSKFGLMQPSSAEDGLRVAQAIVRDSAGEIGLVVIDSVAAMNPEESREKELGEEQIGAQGRAVSRLIRQLRDDIKRTDAAWVFINQLRSVIPTSFSEMRSAKYKPLTTTPGGRALKFYASLRLEFAPQVVERIEGHTIFDADKQKLYAGQRSVVTVVKNKHSEPFRSGTVHLKPGEGFDSIKTCVDFGLRLGILRGSEKTLHVPPPYCAPGLMEQTFTHENIREFLSDNPEQCGKLYEAVASKLKEMEVF